MDRLVAEGHPVNYLRVRSLPFNGKVREFVQKHERVYVVEMNHTGQMHQILTIEFPAESTRLISLTHNNGLPLTARWITEQITEKENR